MRRCHSHYFWDCIDIVQASLLVHYSLLLPASFQCSQYPSLTSSRELAVICAENRAIIAGRQWRPSTTDHMRDAARLGGHRCGAAMHWATWHRTLRPRPSKLVDARPSAMRSWASRSHEW